MAAPAEAAGQPWLHAVLARNAGCAYLRGWGSPRTLDAFRAQVPPVAYEDLARDWLPRLRVGDADLLFAGRPCAFERTGGSSGGSKLVPYAREGLADFQAAVVPWLAAAVARHGIEGSIYFATSPATRRPEQVAGVPVGLPDGAYLGEQWGLWVAQHSAVPLDLLAEPDVDAWRRRTLQALREARDLEFISVWSPTFFLRLLEDLPDPAALWPRLKLVSCWASASSREAAARLRALLPHAHFQPKGLLSTECVVTVPDEDGRPVLQPHGFFEFDDGGTLRLASELQAGGIYEVIATTGSGLYRYRTRDRVRCEGLAAPGRPVLEFIGRAGIACDLVGEKLEEAFVDEALAAIPGMRFLTPAPGREGYTLVAEPGAALDLARIEAGLELNPQYAYARRLGQLAALRVQHVPRLYDRYVDWQLARGVRLGDVKPLALLPEAPWLPTEEPA